MSARRYDFCISIWLMDLPIFETVKMGRSNVISISESPRGGESISVMNLSMNSVIAGSRLGVEVIKLGQGVNTLGLPEPAGRLEAER
jgi:hypothetical protein